MAYLPDVLGFPEPSSCWAGCTAGCQCAVLRWKAHHGYCSAQLLQVLEGVRLPSCSSEGLSQ